MQRWVIPFLVVLAFSAGFAARMWTERHGALPHAPTPGAEFVGPASAVPASAIDRAKLIEEMNRIGPQIGLYRQRMDEIRDEFLADFVKCLTPEQRAHFEERQMKHAEKRHMREVEDASGTPLSDQQIETLRREPLWNALWSVAINWRLDFFCKEYKLTEEQRGEVCQLLKERREKFLNLVDSTPPPTISLSELALRAQRLGEPAK